MLITNIINPWKDLKTVYEKVSIIVPTMAGRCRYLPYLIKSLSVQESRPYEVIIVAKKVDTSLVERVVSGKGFRTTVIKQERGYFTDALNIGKSEAKGDLAVFTDDDDAIVPKNWLKTYHTLHEKYGHKVACISSRDILLDITKKM